MLLCTSAPGMETSTDWEEILNDQGREWKDDYVGERGVLVTSLLPPTQGPKNKMLQNVLRTQSDFGY